MNMTVFAQAPQRSLSVVEAKKSVYKIFNKVQKYIYKNYIFAQEKNIFYEKYERNL